MQWDDLRVFLAAARAGKAARTLRRCARIAYDAPPEYFRPLTWLAKRLGDRVPRGRASGVALQLEAIRAVARLGILPCFVSDVDPLLKRPRVP